MDLLQYINPIKIFALITFFVVLANYDRGKRVDVLLFCIVFLGVFNEIVSLVLRYFSLSISTTTSFYVVLNNVLWLLILYHISSHKKIIAGALLLFVNFCIINFLFIDGMYKFNSYSFILGALSYVILFIVDSFYELRKENFDYFLSVNYILIFIPVLFFIGFSFIFAFKNKDIDKIEIAKGITLYHVISYFVNIIYYSLINIYVYRNRKSKYVE